MSASSSAAPFATLAKVADDKINAAGKTASQKYAKAFFDDGKAGKYDNLGDQETADFKGAMKPEIWKQTADALKGKYGDFKSLDFVDAWDNGKGQIWYRYKAAFSKAPKQEVRVDLDDKNKVAKFGVYDWVDATP